MLPHSQATRATSQSRATWVRRHELVLGPKGRSGGRWEAAVSSSCPTEVNYGTDEV